MEICYLLVNLSYAVRTPLTTVYIAAMIGNGSGAFCKASKYSLFDSTKRDGLIPLMMNFRPVPTGKAAVDELRRPFSVSLAAQQTIFRFEDANAYSNDDFIGTLT